MTKVYQYHTPPPAEREKIGRTDIGSLSKVKAEIMAHFFRGFFRDRCIRTTYRSSQKMLGYHVVIQTGPTTQAFIRLAPLEGHSKVINEETFDVLRFVRVDETGSYVSYDEPYALTFDDVAQLVLRDFHTYPIPLAQPSHDTPPGLEFSRARYGAPSWVTRLVEHASARRCVVDYCLQPFSIKIRPLSPTGILYPVSPMIEMRGFRHWETVAELTDTEKLTYMGQVDRYAETLVDLRTRVVRVDDPFSTMTGERGFHSAESKKHNEYFYSLLELADGTGGAEEKLLRDLQAIFRSLNI